MNTTLRMKIVLPTSFAGEQPVKIGVPGPVREVGSTAAKEFLAMRARQKAAQVRTRRWKRATMAVVLSGMAVAGFTSWRHHDRSLALDGREPALAAAPTLLAPAPASARAIETPAPAAEAPPLSPVVPSSAAVLPTEVARIDDSPVAQCKLDFAHHQWRALLASCTKAFAIAPDATVALRIAHGHWSTGEVAPAGQWAAKAVELGTQNADAFVLIGHAERQAGHPRAALAAYHRYLKWAPNGWHAHNIRAAIRELTEPGETSPPASPPQIDPR